MLEFCFAIHCIYLCIYWINNLHAKRIKKLLFFLETVRKYLRNYYE